MAAHCVNNSRHPLNQVAKHRKKRLVKMFFCCLLSLVSLSLATLVKDWLSSTSTISNTSENKAVGAILS